jgi:hypothetical protein
VPDYTLEDTVYKRFTTRAFATGIPTTLAGTPVVSAYEDDSITQITAGITLGVDHDSVTGLNLLTIVATAANGYEAGKSYDLVITTGTVDSVSVVGEVVWHFTLSAEAAAVDLANGTDGLGAIKADTAAILIDTGTTLDVKIDTIDATVDAILVDTAEIGAAGASLTAINLPDQTMNITGNITGNLSGSVGSVTGAVGSLTTNNDKTGYALTSAEKDAVADHTLRRTAANARASADGDAVTFRSLLGAISKLVNRIDTTTVAGRLTIMEEDDSTSFGAQALTTDATADPVTVADTV